jgi:hypothetical protein
VLHSLSSSNSNHNREEISMPAVIRVKGRGAKPAAKKSVAKTTEDTAPQQPIRRSKSKGSAKPTPTRRDSTTKTAAKAAPAKRAPGRPAKRTAETATPSAPAAAPQRRNSTGVDPKVEARALKAVKSFGDRRAKAEAEHQEAINALHQAAKEALELGVSMAKVSDASGISRQWLYKMGDFRGRGSNGASAQPTAAKATPAKAAAKTVSRRSTGRKSTTTRQASKQTGGSRRRVNVRSAA